jgi:hypothetical protein
VFNCTEGVLGREATRRLLDQAWKVLDLDDAAILVELLHG